ncbi:unnamed protein product [Colias eurytheme]|nr:uncharacterized protein LOC119828799 isoform X1 [Zerene cesonia]CAG4957549.1 unnamed protein product [Colias eurytheme]
MSAKSYTTGSMRSCAGSVRLGTAAGHEVVLDALYDRKRDKKSVRVLTVIIYVFCVSLAAIMLSLYYVFFWEPKDAQYAQRKVSNTVTQPPSTTPMPTCFMTHTGRSNTSVNEYIAQSTIENITSFMNTNESLSSTEDWLSNATATSMQDNSTTYDDSDSLHINNVT